MHVPFINSPIWGKDVIIDVEEDVIGGREGLGEGWRMLMECLSVGRGISLPAVTGFASKFSTLVTLMYSSIRKQFGMPVAKFEAIEEVLARMIANTYTSEAIRRGEHYNQSIASIRARAYEVSSVFVQRNGSYSEWGFEIF